MNEPSPYLDLLKKTLTGAIYDESAWSMEGLPAARLSVMRPLQLLRESFRGVRRALLGIRSGGKKVLIHKSIPDAAAVEEGRAWPLFGYSMIGHKRMDNIHFCLDRILEQKVPGDLLEAGVWRGGATIFMRAVLREHGIVDRNVWVADSFEGLPPPTTRDQQTSDPDVSDEPFLKVSLGEVKKNFARFDLLDEQVRFLPGWFSQTLPTAPIGALALLRVDGDLYSSTSDVLNALYPKLSPGGFIIIDDYHSWQGCRQAVDEYRQTHHITTPIERIDWTGIYWQKQKTDS